MREILFRGKRKDTGEWIEGYYAKAKDYLSEKEMHVIFPLDLTLYPHSEFSGYYEVDPETVGQYIGYMDKNCKKVFEGDILGYAHPSGRVDRCAIGYEGSSFIYHTPQEYRLDVGDPIEDSDYGINIEIREVIGNIHDNPELLEVE